MAACWTRSTASQRGRKSLPPAPGSCPTAPSTGCCGHPRASRWWGGPTRSTWTMKPPTKPASESLSGLVGQSVNAIDTPALVIDLDAMKRNMARMAEFARKHGVRWRPHAKMHKSVALAKLQLQAGAVGVCVQKTAEAEVMVAGGIHDVYISNEVIA